MKNIFKEDLKTKVICVLFAFILWLYVMSYDNPIVTSEHKDVAVNISNMKDVKTAELVLSPNEKLMTKVILKGRRKNVLEAEREGFKPYGIISEPKEGVNILKLDLDVDNSYVEYILSPKALSVNLEKNVLEQKPVEVEFKGTLGENLHIEKLQTNPSSIYVEGPKSLVDRVVSLKVVIDITGNTKDFSKKLPVVAVDKGGNVIEGLKLNEDSVFIHATVFQTKKVPVQLKLTGQEEGDRRLRGYTIAPAEIEISAPSDIIEEIKEIYTRELDVNELVNVKEYVSALDLPKKVNAKIKEVTIFTSFERLITEKFEIPKSKLSVRGGQMQNFSDNDKVPDTIEVKVIFSEETGNIITEDDITLYVEMKDIEKNPANVPIKAEIKKTYETVEISPVELDLEGQ